MNNNINNNHSFIGLANCINNATQEEAFDKSLTGWVYDGDTDDPQYIFHCRKLAAEEVKKVCYNRISSLVLRAYSLSSIPNAVCSLMNLKTLNLRRNQITEVPEAIGCLVNLETLSLRRNKITALPNSIGKLVNLKKLFLGQNRLTKLPESIGTLINLEEFCADNNSLTELPNSIGKLVKVEKLMLFVNKLETIPDSIGNLINLRNLILYSNKLDTIPDTIGNLIHLITLDFQMNQLTSIPDSITKLVNLEKLYFNINKINTIPIEIGRLLNLKLLMLHNNAFEVFPNQIINLVNLKEVSLDINQISVIPDDIERLISLQRISLNRNPNLQSLPFTLGNCRELIWIEIDERNDLIVQREAILNRCQALRMTDGVLDLPTRLASWKTYSGIPQYVSQDFSYLSNLSNFDAQQQGYMSEWLLRLESCKDFQHCRQKLAALVCEIFLSLDPSRTQQNSSTFKEAFFRHLSNDLTACGDRAAMLLNMVYTDWKIYSMPVNARDEGKLAIMEGVARTITLRDSLQRQLMQIGARDESVEIYLYYEIKLKSALKLETAIDNMLYATIGNRPVIDEKALETAVNEGYLDTLVHLDSLEDNLEQILGKNKKYEEEKDRIDDLAQKELELLYNIRQNYQDQEYRKAVDAVGAKRKSEIAELRKKYITLLRSS